jgi:hypothetical protein
MFDDPHRAATPPLVTLVTVFHNRAAWVRETLGCLLAQSHPALEIIAVDDGSTDDTGAILESIADPRLRVVRQANAGLTVTLNRAIRMGSGVYVAIHGSGDLCGPERIARQVELLESRPEVGVVGCWWVDEDLAGGARVLHAPLFARSFGEMVLERNVFGHGEVMYRRALFDRVGGYREFFRYAQDRDLWVRMSRHCEHAVAQDFLYHRRRLPGGVSASADKTIHQALLSDFAAHCGREVAAGRPDPLEALGPSAALLRPRSRRIADRLAATGARFIARGELEPGRRLIAAGLRERLTLRSLAAALLSLATRTGRLWRGALGPAFTGGSAIVDRWSADPEAHPRPADRTLVTP